jgi:hypothetical protein
MPHLPQRFERQLSVIRITKSCKQELNTLKVDDEPIGETVYRCVKFYKNKK